MHSCLLGSAISKAPKLPKSRTELGALQAASAERERAVLSRAPRLDPAPPKHLSLRPPAPRATLFAPKCSERSPFSLALRHHLALGLRRSLLVDPCPLAFLQTPLISLLPLPPPAVLQRLPVTPTINSDPQWPRAVCPSRLDQHPASWPSPLLCSAPSAPSLCLAHSCSPRESQRLPRNAWSESLGQASLRPHRLAFFFLIICVSL